MPEPHQSPFTRTRAAAAAVVGILLVLLLGPVALQSCSNSRTEGSSAKVDAPAPAHASTPSHASAPAHAPTPADAPKPADVQTPKAQTQAEIAGAARTPETTKKSETKGADAPIASAPASASPASSSPASVTPASTAPASLAPASSTPASSAPAPAAPAPAADDGPTDDAVRTALAVVQAQAESSLSGVLDTAAVLDAALLLSKLPMQQAEIGADHRLAPAFTPKKLPLGVDLLGIWVALTPGPKGGRPLTFKVKLQRPAQPNVVAGVARLGAEIELTVVVDDAGAPMEHRLLARLGSVPQEPETPGSNATPPDVLEGVGCLLDATALNQKTVKCFGIRDGRAQQWDGELANSGADPGEKWGKLRKILLARLQELEKH